MTGQTSGDQLVFNGIDGESGDYALPPMTVAELLPFIKGEGKPENLSDLRHKHETRNRKHLGVPAGVDPRRLDQTGWGIVFPSDADPETTAAIQEALDPLLKRRQSQAQTLYKVLEYRPGESKNSFLVRYGAAPGPAVPSKVPYYLLLCADPERISFEFQSQLDVQYAVGRLHFDRIEDYAHYASSVEAAEKGEYRRPRRLQFFGVANPLDQATNLSAKYLVNPLHEELAGTFQDWSFSAAMAEDATKVRLGTLLGGEDTPALLFTASHGMAFPLDSHRQRPHQGALLCQDWPGPGTHRGPIPESFYFAADDLATDANLGGLIAMFFACFGAGTPELDAFPERTGEERARIAPRAFLAELPKRMLALPRGGALAVVGHVERAWSYSFRWPGAGAQTGVFRNTLHQLLEGYPVGAALEYFNARYAELSTDLTAAKWANKSSPRAAQELTELWTANNDARGYSLIGDPAVRLAVEPLA
jgi:hypothetical protein